MAPLTVEQVQRSIETCGAHLAEMGETFRSKLGCDIRLSAEEPGPYAEVAGALGIAREAAGATDTPGGFHEPGLAVSLVLGQQAALLLIPGSILPPDLAASLGVSSPGLSEAASENERLQSFAHELSQAILPPDLRAERSFATAAPSLRTVAEAAQIDPLAIALVLPVVAAPGSEADVRPGRILFVVPVESSRVPPAAQIERGPLAGAATPLDELSERPSEFSQPADSASAESESSDPSTASEAFYAAKPAGLGLSRDEALRALRILNVPVTVSVRLAERRMALGQVVALVPGALVPFNKSCEDLLDLFVNNHRYCQGEAIKIGENFGLKVAKVGVIEQRKERVL